MSDHAPATPARTVTPRFSHLADARFATSVGTQDVVKRGKHSKNRVYVAGPYTWGDPAVNTRNAILAGDELATHGLAPYIPHLTHFWHILCPHELEFWYAHDLEWLRVCDALVRLEGPSTGADREVGAALAWGIPVFHSVKECLEAIA